MLDTDSLMNHRGDEVHDRDGRKIGRLEEVYLDDDTDEPKWALVNTGPSSSRRVFVPLRGARTTDRALHLDYPRDLIAEAPRVPGDEHLSLQEEEELYRYYGLEHPRPAERPADGADAPRDVGDGASSADDAMTRSEEELHVETVQRPTGRARLRKYVVTEHVTVTVPVQREEVRVEHEPVDGAEEADRGRSGTGEQRVVDAGPATEDDLRRAGVSAADAEDGAEVILHEEEVVVDTRVVPKERVRLAKEVVTDEQRVADDVRKERIDVERDDTT